jgi:hypothetical protein
MSKQRGLSALAALCISALKLEANTRIFRMPG